MTLYKIRCISTEDINISFEREFIFRKPYGGIIRIERQSLNIIPSEEDAICAPQKT